MRISLTTLVAASFLVACNSSEPDQQSATPFAWSAPTNSTIVRSEISTPVALSDRSVAVLNRGYEGAEDVLTLSLVRSGTSAVSTFQLLRKTGYRCCVPAPAKIQTDGLGGAYVVWMDRQNGSILTLSVVYFSPGSGVTHVGTVLSQPGNSVRQFDLAVRRDGSATLAWAESTPDSPASEVGPSAVFTAEIGTDRRISPASQVSPVIASNEAGIIDIAVSTSTTGRRALLWTQLANRFSTNVLWATVSSSMGIWGAPTRLTSNTTADEDLKPTVSHIQASIDDQGSVVAIWKLTASDRTVERLLVNTTQGTAGWSGPRVVSGSATSPALATGSDGRSLLVFVDQSNRPTSRPNIKLVQVQGSTLSPAINVTPLDSVAPQYDNPQIATLANGLSLILWSELGAGPSVSVKYRTRTPSGGLTDAQVLAANGGGGSLSAPGADSAVSFWGQYNATIGSAQLWYSAGK